MFNIMLVDDHRNFRRALKLVLHDQFSSLNVIEAGNGEEAIKKADSQPVDLIFMDIHLPGKGGLETTLEIKANHQGIPVAILTGNDLPE